VWQEEEPGLDIQSVLQLMQQFDEADVSGQALQLPLRVWTLSPPKLARFVHENRLLFYVVVRFAPKIIKSIIYFNDKALN